METKLTKQLKTPPLGGGRERPRGGRVRLNLALLSWVAAVAFAIVGMLLPPQGEISGSVLILVAQLLVLCATFLGIDGYVNIIKSPPTPKGGVL